MKATKILISLFVVVMGLALVGSVRLSRGRAAAPPENASTRPMLDRILARRDAAADPDGSLDLADNRRGASPAAVSAASAQATVLTWQIETVDSAGDAGKHTSLALDSSDHPHVSYFDETNDDLRYAHHDGARWYTQTVDSAGSVGWHSSLALDSADQPHISYYDVLNSKLKYAYYDGSTWVTETVDSAGSGDIGGYTSLALDSNDQPHISYYDGANTALKYAVHDGSGWISETVDNSGDVGAYTSLALDSNDRPHISYISSSPQAVRYAYPDGTGWYSETVYESSSRPPAFTSLSLDAGDVPHLSFYLGPPLSSVMYTLVYATHDGSEWQNEAVDSEGVVGRYPSLALDPAGGPHISYSGDGNLKCAYHIDDTWYTETVDSAGTVGTYTSLALDSTGQPHISYYDETNGDLKHASDVPLRFQRQAAQLIAEMRGTGMAPGWDMAQLGSGVQPLYRPDVEGIAYYEFPVVVPAEVRADARRPLGAAGFESAGFVIVSTGDHDFPIPHWDFTGQSLSLRLKQAADEAGKVAERFYKLDVLTYVAEDEQGELAATLGGLPPKVSGMDPAWLDAPPSFEVLWTPDAQAGADDHADEISGTLVVSGTITPPSSLKWEEWGSWRDLKIGYSETYSVLLTLLHDDASEAWEVETLVQEGGRLRKGDVRILAMLWPDPTVSLSGEGAERGYVECELIPTQRGLAPNLQISVLDSALGETILFTVTAGYPNGVLETFSFEIVEPYEVWLPLIMRADARFSPSADGASFVAHRSEYVAPQAIAGWTDWSYVWVGSHADQRWYNQIESGDPPNTSDCWSGCGATAWAMLFGWADYQADVGNPYWDGRWGLYRENGGYGADAVAPGGMDAGVENMIWEIRNDIDTWCNAINDNGATWASDMPEARAYLNGRSYTRLLAWGNNVSIPLAKYRRRAESAIRYRAPAVIGIGAWRHYPLAYGFKKRQYKVWGVTLYTQRKFYVNLGWGDSSERGWVTSRIWFAGEIRPHVPVETNEIDDVALHRASDHKWYYDYGHDGDTDSVGGAWGKQAGDVPLAGDFDRDGLVDDTLIFRIDDNDNGQWHYNYDHDGDTDEQRGPWGWGGDLPLVGDFDRDGRMDDVAVYRPSTHIWYYDYDHDGDTDATSGSWGWAGDLPFAGDFDRDGFVDDVAAFRPSTHVVYYDYNHNGTTDEEVAHWTTETGLPIAGDFDQDGFVDDVAFFIPDWEPVSIWLYDYDHNGPPNDISEWGWEDGLPVVGAFGENEDPS